MSGTKAIHEVPPREQVGAATGDRYEFQYQMAALECLAVFESIAPKLVLCEWHDDFVVATKVNPDTLYAFHQVKTRVGSSGPWGLREFLGLRKKTKKQSTPPADQSSVCGRMFDHLINFPNTCTELAFLTNSSASEELSKFLDAIKQAGSLSSLTGDAAATFNELAGAYNQTFNANPQTVFEFLKRLTIQNECGALGDLRQNLLKIGARILDLSEIDLHISEAIRIGDELVNSVRTKSHQVLSLPISETELLSAKALTTDDILPLLALSPDGFAYLRAAGDRKALKSLSRIQRIGKRLGIKDELIADMCRYKVDWETWFQSEAANLDSLELSLLRQDCIDLLALHSAGTLPFDNLASQIKQLAAKYSAKLNVKLDGALVMGLLFSLAAESQIKTTK